MKGLLIRADASEAIGHGHIMRMIALGQAWENVGGSVFFASIECPERLVVRLRNEGFKCIEMTSLSIGSNEDSSETRALADRLGVGVVFLDGYAFDEAYLVAIEDRSDFRLGAIFDEPPTDVLLDLMDLGVYPCLAVPRTTKKLLCGSDYVLLRQEFLRNHEVSIGPKVESEGCEHLLVCLGGSDPVDLTSGIVEALFEHQEAFQRKISIRVIVGASYSNTRKIRDFIETSDSDLEVNLLENVSNMLEQYIWADKVVSASGGMVWEWLYYGVCGGVFAIAENQVPFYQGLVANQLARGLGNVAQGELFVPEKLVEFVSLPVDRQCNVKDSIIDGKGAKRIVDALLLK